MCPNIVVFLEIGTEVARSIGVVPQVNGHVGKGGRCHELAWCAVRDWCARDSFSTFDERVIDFDGSSETWALGAADVDWGEWIFLDC